MSKNLVPGGIAYIRSHTIIQMLISGYNVITINPCDMASEKPLKGIEKTKF